MITLSALESTYLMKASKFLKTVHFTPKNAKYSVVNLKCVTYTQPILVALIRTHNKEKPVHNLMKGLTFRNVGTFHPFTYVENYRALIKF